MCDRTLAENAKANAVGRPLSEMSEAVVALTAKAAAMLDEVRAGVIWAVLTYKMPVK